MPAPPTRRNRTSEQLREIQMATGFMPAAEGSCLVSFGETKVICSATVDDRVPPFLDPDKSGWITAEYSMLPRATPDRTDRRRNRGPKGRTQEIERLIGRALRQAVSLRDIAGYTILVDCDVMRADGGTRTASITGGWVALRQALGWMVKKKKLKSLPPVKQIAAVSVGLIDEQVRVDLDYREDVAADVDLNLVMIEGGGLIEIQGTAEGAPFSRKSLDELIDGGAAAIEQLYGHQRDALG